LFFIANLCKINDNYLIKLEQIDNGSVISRGSRSKYLANDKKIKSASRQLRQGSINILTFLLRCSYTVETYEERMRRLALNELVENEGGEEQPNIIGNSKFKINSTLE